MNSKMSELLKCIKMRKKGHRPYPDVKNRLSYLFFFSRKNIYYDISSSAFTIIRQSCVTCVNRCYSKINLYYLAVYLKSS